MVELQYLVFCQDDDGIYVQATRRRFPSHEAAGRYAETVAPTRNPIVMADAAVPIDEDDYPLEKGCDREA